MSARRKKAVIGGFIICLALGYIAPDTLVEGGEVVAEGRLNTDGVFEATTIITKCPSKYVPEK